jgi:hypothetical protein
MLQSLRTLITSLAIASVVGSVAQAYASTNTAQAPSRAQISTAGVVIAAVKYDTEANFLRSVNFHVNAPSATVKIRLRAGGDWLTCSNRVGTVRCETHNFPASAVERLEVAAG